MSDFLKKLINLPSEEEMEVIRQQNYEHNRQNPNTFSHWFQPLAGVLQKEFLIPESVCLELPLDLKTRIEQDMHRITDETKNEFVQFVWENESVQNLHKQSPTLFMKSGVFSNKFEFNGSCKLTVKQDLFDQYYNIHYAAALYGANYTNEIVLRAYVEDVEDRALIYDGMPLRTEFRVFFDFTTDQFLGIANYWHFEEMRHALVPYSVKKTFADISDVAAQKKLAKDIVQKLKDEKLQLEFDVYFAHLEQLQQIEQEYHTLKKQVAVKVQKALTGTHALEGAWSIDIMKNGNEFYFIDAARMNDSALVNRMESI